MSRIQLSIAIGNYDRNRPLLDGRVKIDGVNPTFMTLSPEEMFFRAMRHEAFDVCELSLSSHTLRVSRGDSAYVGIPAFVSRAFRHNCILINSESGIRSPKDLEGRRVGIPEWQLTANVWIRAFLCDDYGVDLKRILWVHGGIEDVGRVEKVAVSLPADLSMTGAPEGESLSEMLSNGEIDAYIGPRLPERFQSDDSKIKWLFEDPREEAIKYYDPTKLFPIMHLIGLHRRSLAHNPWLPVALLKAFTESKEMSIRELTDTSASKITLPFTEEMLRGAIALLGRDYWSYGYAANLDALTYFTRQHHAQWLSERVVEPAELFDPSTLDSMYRV